MLSDRSHTIFKVDAKGFANALEMGYERKISLGICLPQLLEGWSGYFLR